MVRGMDDFVCGCLLRASLSLDTMCKKSGLLAGDLSACTQPVRTSPWSWGALSPTAAAGLSSL